MFALPRESTKSCLFPRAPSSRSRQAGNLWILLIPAQKSLPKIRDTELLQDYFYVCTNRILGWCFRNSFRNCLLGMVSSNPEVFGFLESCKSKIRVSDWQHKIGKDMGKKNQIVFCSVGLSSLCCARNNWNNLTWKPEGLEVSFGLF